ncbi:UDP-N-acetylmuramoyl-L-alanyl-D-glutamate--2,6-diaminopimelate ligase [[Clostridium] fimetarium]|uniref:UDP-N-acetylmuramoyl-L-alanyl-D-glutamate--2,6-diaminopimelate ligase n=1 Tax=[Clostridium] fimetarium TaxID=99656 RepID=A0A1I0MRV1_9FIRM|nr:UDP-N-acetylmuramoyl-L-alanyl-D-glutamate--2,6-diaminopimelate ligase [[Clostridium] fimetarium]SEV91382.1 UDP-N-acetylmuramoyl-L-alanyl-D-glutamate--2,6-diaminopimelate ligase [[Clostridium] fimetarium]
MKLIKLLEHLDYEIMNGKLEVEVGNLTSDSRLAKENTVFICIVGAVSDGHKYINAVVEKGASAIIVQDGVDLTKIWSESKLPEGLTIIKVKDTRYAFAFMSAAYFDYPASKMFTIGITGTKGKTTTAYMVRNVLDACGIKTGLIGTIETIIGEDKKPACNTTPESYEIHESFAKMVEAGCKAVVMEVSSQGLMLHRTAGITFDIGVFTNLEPDHIGPNEHESFEQYLECKAMLFKQSKIAIVNADDEHVDAILKNSTCTVERYGLGDTADIRATNIEFLHEPGKIGTQYRASGLVNMDIKLQVPGKFSVYNSLCAVAVTRHFKVDEEILKRALYEVQVKGRIEIIPVSDKFTLMIDYAHNAMALESILKTLKEYHPHRLISLFGCGGNRSKLRRFEMGEVSGTLADLTVITSDNPRFEEPEAIIEDIKTGMAKTLGKYVTIIDRKEAIKYVIEHGEPGDIIVLAGKGHEDYQEIKGVKHPMDERVLIAEVLEELKNEA